MVRCGSVSTVRSSRAASSVSTSGSGSSESPNPPGRRRSRPRSIVATARHRPRSTGHRPPRAGSIPAPRFLSRPDLPFRQRSACPVSIVDCSPSAGPPPVSRSSRSWQKVPCSTCTTIQASSSTGKSPSRKRRSSSSSGQAFMMGVSEAPAKAESERDRWAFTQDTGLGHRTFHISSRICDFPGRRSEKHAPKGSASIRRGRRDVEARLSTAASKTRRMISMESALPFPPRVPHNVR